jgi:hypothetical protein
MSASSSVPIVVLIYNSKKREMESKLNDNTINEHQSSLVTPNKQSQNLSNSATKCRLDSKMNREFWKSRLKNQQPLIPKKLPEPQLPELENAETSCSMYGFIITVSIFFILNFNKIKNNLINLFETIEIILSLFLTIIYIIYFVAKKKKTINK